MEVFVCCKDWYKSFYLWVSHTITLVNHSTSLSSGFNFKIFLSPAFLNKRDPQWWCDTVWPLVLDVVIACWRKMKSIPFSAASRYSLKVLWMLRSGRQCWMPELERVSWERWAPALKYSWELSVQVRTFWIRRTRWTRRGLWAWAWRSEAVAESSYLECCWLIQLG